MIKIDQLIRSKRRTILLQIKSDGTFIVRAPLRTDINRINQFVKEKNNWIITKQSEIKKRFQELQETILGHTTKNEILFLGESISFAPKKEMNKSQLISWYEESAWQYLSQRVDFFTKKFGLNYNRVKINSAKTRWGSCSSKGNINFSWRLIMAPKDVVDYVVIHEIAHLKHRNHSARFWNFVEEMMPQHENQRKWLRKHGFLLDV
jgi:predicted metal-dependent hydrolase